MEKIVLIDGHSILNRAFYGVPPLTNAKGQHTNAVYGFLNILFKILGEENPQYLTVAFDMHAPTFRHEMYKEYKGTRKPMPEELREQVPMIKEVLQAMGVQIVQMEGLEADDILGTIAKRSEKEGMEVSLVSGDRDLLQIASEHIKIRIPKTKGGKTEIEDYYAKDVETAYKVTPKQFIELKALMGDTADNIPGVAGIGEKMATKIISTYHSIENAYEHLEEIEPKRAGKLLGEDYESAKLSKVLATINIEAPIEIDYKAGKLDSMYNDESLSFIKRLEFKKLAEKFISNGASISAASTVNIEEIVKVISEDEINIKELIKAEHVGICGYKISGKDNEPTQITFDFLDMNNGLSKDIYPISFSYILDDKEYIYYVEFDSSDNLETFIKQLINNNVQVSLFDLKRHLKAFECFNILEVNIVYELNLMAYLINPLRVSYNYEDIAREYLNIDAVSVSELFGKADCETVYKDNKHNFIMSTAWNSYIAVKTVDILLNKLKDANMWQLYLDIELPLVYALNRMEQEGILVNATELKEYGNILKEKIGLIEKEIYDEIGE